ncbi:MAG: CRTAC1 family protein [Deltaproteobacteria bacterium]|nr:CRTAC1 family protein [Deltaproteobacteria bacterium]
MKSRLRSRTSALLLFGLGLVACGGDSSDSKSGEKRPGERDTSLSEALPSSEPQAEVFREVAEEVGLRFEHRNGAIGELALPEIMGPGVGLLDYDGDGDLDILLRRGGALDGTAGGGTVLFRNDLDVVATPATLRFVEVSAADSGLSELGYGMGITVGDINGDSFPDLYLTNFGFDQLWSNRGDGSFKFRRLDHGGSKSSWSVSASFLDYDADGDLDLYVANYIDFRRNIAHPCFHPSSALDYCGPDSYDDVGDRLYRNRGDGTFEDVTGESGIGSLQGAGLGTLVFDADGDHRPDLYVANDADENFYWHNSGDGTFVQEGVLTGLATNGRGEKEAGMGIAYGDADGDGDGDLFVTHLDGESNTLYLRGANGRVFSDATAVAGLGVPSLPLTCFGTAFLDYDNDGILDLFTVCGAVKLFREGGTAPEALAQRNQLFRGLGQGRFQEVSETSGEAMELTEVSRGLAVGDLDNDGDPDLVVANNSGPARLLLNQVGNVHAWIGVEPVRRKGGLVVVGTEVHALLGDGRRLWRTAHRDGSYASSRDPRVLFGLGTDPSTVTIRVVWPGGVTEQWHDLPPNRYHELVKGTGRPSASESSS